MRVDQKVKAKLVSLAEAQAVMATIIAKKVFSSTSGDLVTAKEAQIRQLAINELT